MISAIETLPPEYFEVVDRIDVLRKQLSYAISDNRRRWTGFLRRSTLARAVRGSNTIEGYNVTQEDAMAAVDEEEPFDADTETWMAIAGYRAAMSYILQLGNDPHYSHNEGTIRGLHYMMVGYDNKVHPGRWRPGAVWVKNEPSGETVYEAPDVQLVPELIAELVHSLNKPCGLPVMIRGALAHLNLVMIHPFSDGNGRMARALQTMVLAREGIIDPQFSSIEEYLGRNSLEYYSVLGDVGRGSWHPENDALPWIKFCLIAHYRQAETLLRRTKETQHLWEVLEQELKNRKLNERLILALGDAAAGFRVRNPTYRKAADVSLEVAGKDLRLLAENGLLLPKGERRARFYVASDWLKEVRQKTREKRARTDPFSDEKTKRQHRQSSRPRFSPRT